MSGIEQRDVGDARWFQAKEGNEIQGFAVSGLTPDGKVSLDSIHVIPGARKNGIVSALLSAIFDWGKKKGATEITGDFFPEYRGGKDEEEARRFYEKRGIQISTDKKLNGKI